MAITPDLLDQPSDHRLTVTHREAARLIGVSERTLWNYAAPNGPLPCVRLGRRRLYAIDDLKRFLRDAAAGKV